MDRVLGDDLDVGLVGEQPLDLLELVFEARVIERLSPALRVERDRLLIVLDDQVEAVAVNRDGVCSLGGATYVWRKPDAT